MKRRTVLQGIGTAGAAAVGLACGLLKPGELLAAEWNKTAFEQKTLADSLKSIGAASPADSKDILIKAPDIAENGAVVPVEVTSRIPDTRTIAILVEKNPFPLSASFDISNGAEGYVSTRIKMGGSSNIKVVVNAGGKSYVATKEVKVTIGGCGG